MSTRVPRRDPRRARRGDRARPRRRLLRRGRGRRRRRVQGTPGLHERFGDERVIDTPISELALAGAAFGAAVTGLRPVIEIMFGDFMALPMDALVNQAAKYWYISNEQGTVPLVVRSAVGGGGRFGADPLADPRDVVPGHPGPQDRGAVDARPRPRACSRARSATTTRSSSSSTSGSTRSRTRCPTAIDVIALGEAPSRAGRRPDDRLDRQGRARRARGGRAARARTASTPRSSTCAPCARSTSRRCSSRSRRPTACWRSRRAAHRRLGDRRARRRGRGGAARPRRRLDRRHRRDPDPVRPTLEDAFMPSADTIVESVSSRFAGAG